MLLPTHIAAGGLALVLGAMALFVEKGGAIHRRSGLLFVYAMLIMGADARAADPAGVRRDVLLIGRVRGRRTLPALLRHDATPLATGAR